MVCEMMNTHGAAKNWPVGSDMFDGENPSVMEHIRANGWLQDHIPSRCEEAIKARGSRELKKCPPSGFYSEHRLNHNQLGERITNSLILLLWHQME